MTQAQDWKQKRAELKRDILKHFRAEGAGNKEIQKICDFIKLYGDFDGETYYHKPDDDHISDNFSPRHRQKTCEFLNRWETLSREDKEFIEAQRPECWARGDFEYSYWLTTPEGKGEIIVYDCKITLESFQFVEGIAPLHPSKERIGQTPSGGYIWEYDKSALPILEKTGLPILKSLGATDS